jgi:hypothetical protein
MIVTTKLNLGIAKQAYALIRLTGASGMGIGILRQK